MNDFLQYKNKYFEVCKSIRNKHLFNSDNDIMRECINCYLADKRDILEEKYLKGV